MATATATNHSIPQTRLDLAKILRHHDSDIPKAAQEIVKILGLEDEKDKSVRAQLVKVYEQLKITRRSLHSLKGEWWDTPILLDLRKRRSCLLIHKLLKLTFHKKSENHYLN